MEGLQTNHHMPCELDIDGKPLALRSISIGYHFLHLCSKAEKKNPQLYAQATSSSHSLKYKALFFLNIGLKLKLTADTLL